jgi:hypothetical protein
VIGKVGRTRWSYAVSKLAEEYQAIAYYQKTASNCDAATTHVPRELEDFVAGAGASIQNLPARRLRKVQPTQ